MKVCPTILSVWGSSPRTPSISFPGFPQSLKIPPILSPRIRLWLWAWFFRDGLWFLYYSCCQFVAPLLWLRLFLRFAFHCLQFFFCTRHGLAWIVNSTDFPHVTPPSALRRNMKNSWGSRLGSTQFCIFRCFTKELACDPRISYFRCISKTL